MHAKFILLLFACLLWCIAYSVEENAESHVIEDIEQSIEITVDNEPMVIIEDVQIENSVEDEVIEKILDCGKETTLG